MNKFISALVLTAYLLLTGCNSLTYNQTEGNIADLKKHIDDTQQAEEALIKNTPPVLVNKGLYIDPTPISLEKQPAWLKNKVVIRGNNMPFGYYAGVINNAAGSHILTKYQSDMVDTNLSINYTGTVKGALDLLATKSTNVYNVRGGKVIYWQSYVTRTFSIAFMPGSANYEMNDSGGNSSFGSSGGGISSAGGSTSFKGDISVWADIEATIKQLLSAKGTVSVSQSSTSVTVKDKPSNVDLVAQYIKNLNSSLSQQVYVKIEVLDVVLTNDYNLGIDWTILQKGLAHTNFVLNGSYGSPLTITPFGGVNLPNIGFAKQPNAATVLSAVVSSLNQQGKVSIVAQPRLVCMNNQVSVVKIVNSEQYIQSVQNTLNTTTSANGASSTGGAVTSQITPGTVMTGLTLYLLPKIMDDKVYLQLKIDLSQNQGITSLCAQSGDGANGCAQSSSVIQSPHIAEKVFNQRSALVSGETLVLSGLKQIQNNTGAMQLFNIQELGGKGATQISNDTVILVTPYVLRATGKN